MRQLEIIKVIERTFLDIVVDTGSALESSFYRRFSAECWEVLLGDSWEPLYLTPDEMEASYQRFLKLKG
jgi:hypothetical protein